MNIIKWLINDVKEDLKTVKEILKGDYKGKYTTKQFFTIDWKELLSRYWLLFLIIVLAFFVGYFFATQRMQDACNQFIINNDLIVRPAYDQMKEVVIDIGRNITLIS